MRSVFSIGKLGRQLIEQNLRVLQISGVEALGEPTVDRSEEVARFGAFALITP
jgi:hypothetical protein